MSLTPSPTAADLPASLETFKQKGTEATIFATDEQTEFIDNTCPAVRSLARSRYYGAWRGETGPNLIPCHLRRGRGSPS